MATIQYSRARAENKKRFSSLIYKDVNEKDTQVMSLETISSNHDVQMVARQGRNVGEVSGDTPTPSIQPTSPTKFNISQSSILSVNGILEGTVLLPSSYGTQIVSQQVIGAKLPYSEFNGYCDELYSGSGSHDGYEVRIECIWDGEPKTIQFSSEGDMPDDLLHKEDLYGDSEIYVTSFYCEVPDYVECLVGCFVFPIVVNGVQYDTQSDFHDAFYSYDAETYEETCTAPQNTTYSGTLQVEQIIDGKTNELNTLSVSMYMDGTLSNIEYLIIPENYTTVTIIVNSANIMFETLELQSATPPTAGGNTINNLKNSAKVKEIIVPADAIAAYEASAWKNTGKLISKVN